MFPESINSLIECFKKLPGIGQKSAERMAFSVINDFADDEYDMFCSCMQNIKNNIRNCKICNCISDTDVCNICGDHTRRKDVLVVVQNSKDVFLLEKVGNFNGYYHVLGGLISPFDDIGPDDISLSDLITRVKDGGIKELIFFTKSGIEADTTMLYIKRLLADLDVVVSKVANGIPVGADVDYIDSLTLELALNNRKEVLD